MYILFKRRRTVEQRPKFPGTAASARRPHRLCKTTKRRKFAASKICLWSASSGGANGPWIAVSFVGFCGTLFYLDNLLGCLLCLSLSFRHWSVRWLFFDVLRFYFILLFHFFYPSHNISIQLYIISFLYTALHQSPS